MNTAAIVLICASFVVLLLGFQTWRLTSSRSIIFNTLFGSMSLMFAAYWSVQRQQLQLTCLIPFIIGMMFAGRAGAVLWRSLRGESELRVPSQLMFVIAGLAFVAAITAYLGV